MWGFSLLAITSIKKAALSTPSIISDLPGEDVKFVSFISPDYFIDIS
ncbi:hypothetical protein [Okeania sp. SIO1H2]|nr:hypothetical protein [Okeania sp. SIO1H2]NET20502.1 hypothetical protein [Okeania sp. SIO1H5]